MSIKNLFSKKQQTVNWGDLKNFKPVSEDWGFDRGKPVDRFYIENFLEKNRVEIKGVCLEFLNNGYTMHFGGSNVAHSDVMDIDRENKNASIYGDASATQSPLRSDYYDCIILTQVLQHIYDVKTALRNLIQSLKPGGVLLITVPFIMRFHKEPLDCWRYTTESLKMLVEEVSPGSDCQVDSYGNLITCIAFLQGLAKHELSDKELLYNDEQYPLTITAVVRK